VENNSKTPEFNAEYHRARRNLTLSGGILLAWEFAGLELQNSAALPLTGISVTIRNPQVVPSILSCLVLFFSIRLFIEWKHSNIIRRSDIFSRADLTLAYSIAIIGVLIFLYQSITQTDIALLASREGNELFSTIIIGFFIFMTGYALGASIANQFDGNRDNAIFVVVPMFLFLCAVPILQLRKYYLVGTLSPLLILLFSAPIIIGFWATYLGYKKEKLTQDNTKH
jgi:hypothetical protein